MPSISKKKEEKVNKKKEKGDGRALGGECRTPTLERQRRWANAVPKENRINRTPTRLGPTPTEFNHGQGACDSMQLRAGMTLISVF